MHPSRPSTFARSRRWLYVATAVAALAVVTAGGCAWLQAARPPAPAAAEPASAAPRRPAPDRARPWSRHIVVDQFGYRPGDRKVAVVRDPREGYDAADRYSAGTRYELRRADDDSVAWGGTLQPWRGGATQSSSGDGGGWFDFSPVRDPGRYVVVDVERGERSAVFRIDREVYRDVLKTAVRTYYYQRAGYPKQLPYAEACWTDDAAYLGPDQDPGARDVTDPTNDAKRRDMRGGWFDAGDTNKYVNNARQTVNQLLTAYTTTPEVFGDDYGLPESGNGIPDLLDEIRWELDWMKRMQFPDGSVAMKDGVTDYGKASPPSSDRLPRSYVPSCTGATISLASVFAHAAVVMRDVPGLQDEARDLERRGLEAWRNFQATPVQTLCDTGIVKGGKANMTAELQRSSAVVAAIYLYALTGRDEFHDLVKADYRTLQPYHDIGWTRYLPDEGEALLHYAKLPTADAALARRILDDKREDVRRHPDLYGDSDDDLYRSWMPDASYHWGSNAVRSTYASSNLDVIAYGLDPAHDESYRERAAGALHYLHGTNPFGMAYLTNMGGLGASHSANRLFHLWYAQGTRWDDARSSECGPAPGLLTGGPNAKATQNGVPASLRPPAGQPPQKSYRDWGGPEASWAITEPAIYYQASYIRALAPFVR